MSVKLEDSTLEKISPLLEKLTKEILSQNVSIEAVQNDLFYVLIIVLMIENGFLPELNDSKILDDVNLYTIENFTSGKSRSGFYEAQFVMTGFQDLPLKLVITPIGALMLINVIFTNMYAETYTVCLPVSCYIVSPQASTIPLIFRDLKHLSVTFKNKILSAVKSKILSFHGYPSASLVGLPDEVLMFNVFFYLPLSDIISISKTCKRFRAIVGNDVLWREILKRDFKKHTPCVTTNWKSLYKEAFLARLDLFRKLLSNISILEDDSNFPTSLDDSSRPLYIFPVRNII